MQGTPPPPPSWVFSDVRSYSMHHEDGALQLFSPS